jgi:hypothetical protein
MKLLQTNASFITDCKITGLVMDLVMQLLFLWKHC